MNTEDTIAAICTGTGGAIAIIRVAGDDALEIGRRIWQGSTELSRANRRRMLFGRTVSGNDKAPGDPALCVYMPKPGSYTGDDVVEIHCHGGILSSQKTLAAAVKAGARHAEPGEFTYRAFINGKMDLTQAEAVADLISAHSEMALHLAERQISGALNTRINEVRNRLIEILAEIESRMDFVDEDLDWTDDIMFVETIDKLVDKLTTLYESRNEGIILRNGIRVVIAGKPNTGKSSLLNLLLGFDRAIVTQIPGTTRDTIEEIANIRNIPVKLIDTAGIREADDFIEGIGIERSLKTLKRAQIVLWLMDASATDLEGEYRTMLEHVPKSGSMIALWNKIDLCKDPQNLPEGSLPIAKISVTENNGIDNFLDLFEKTAWQYPHQEEPEIAISSRHASLIKQAMGSLPLAEEQFSSGNPELIAIHLREAISSLGEAIGVEVDPDILDTIFSKFCIGK